VPGIYFVAALLPLFFFVCFRLLPSQDQVAVAIAERQRELWEAGWKVIPVKPSIVSTLRDKALMIEYLDMN